MSFPAALRKLLFGTPFGEVFPPKPNPHPLAIDGRTAALRVLRTYVTNLTFYRENAAGKPPIVFQVRPENFQIEWPDHEFQMVTPMIVVLEGNNADYNTIGLTSYVEEQTADVFAPGTVLQWQEEYVETINLEVWASSKAERRALMSGLETAFNPTEQMSGLRFQMPDYYNELVCFTLQRRRIVDDEMSARNRRKAQLELEMRFNVVALVNYVPMRPVVVVDVDVDDQGTPVVIDPTNDPGADTPDLNPDTQNPNYNPDTQGGDPGTNPAP